MPEKSFSISGFMKIVASKSRYGYYDGRIASFTKSKPSLSSNEIAVAITVKVPVAFFERMTPVVEIELPEEAVVHPNIESVIKLSAMEIADKLQLQVDDVEDGLKQLIQAKNEEMADKK